MIVLCFIMQGGDIVEHTNGKCHLIHFSMQEEDIPECKSNAQLSFVYTFQLVDHCVT
jgi:hypothetical protein